MKSEENGDTLLFIKRLVIRKSDGRLHFRCENCNEVLPVPAGVARPLKTAVLLIRTS